MREIIISRPNRLECRQTTLNIEINGKPLAKLKNGQRIVMNADEGQQVIRVHGGFMAGKAFQDTIKIPTGQYSYSFQVDMLSVSASRHVPLLRPVGGEPAAEDSRTIALLGAKLTKFLLEEEVRETLRKCPGASLHVVLQPKEWQVLLRQGEDERVLLHSGYSTEQDGFDALLTNVLRQVDLRTPEGRTQIAERVLTDYIAWLPDYDRIGENGLTFKG